MLLDRDNEIRAACTAYRKAKADRDAKRATRDSVLFKTGEALRRSDAARITGMSLGGVQAAIERGKHDKLA